MKSEIMSVTPKMATEWLEQCNTNNRSVSDRLVKRYASDMTRGAWRLTHQGIAFGEDGMLYDGQHRLFAVLESGATVKMMVTTGLPESARAEIDGARKRTVADNFAILSGRTNAKKLVELANIIRLLVAHNKVAGTYAETSEYVKKYEAGIEWAIGLPKAVRLLSAAVRGAMAFAHKTSPEKVEQFAELLLSGANLKETDPALVLRNHLMRVGTTLSSQARRDRAVRTLRALAAHVNGQPLAGKLYATEDSVVYFGRAHGLTLQGSSTAGTSVFTSRLAGKKR